MWSFRTTLRNGLLALAFSAATGLAGCSSFTPVYGDNGTGIETASFRYAKPATRLDQIIYQELILKLGRSSDGASPTLRVTTKTDNRELARSGMARPSEQREAVVTATFELIAADGSVTFSAERSASALYSTDIQGLASAEALREAEERAAKALAETIRLTLTGALAQRAN